jgi:hypothetical protein
MKSRFRVSNAFTALPDLGLIAFFQAVIICLTGNAAFTSLAALLAELTTALTAFEAAVAAMAQTTSPKLTAVRDEARITLLDTARKTGAAVQSIALNSLSTLLSSGFINTPPPSAPVQLPAPTIQSLDNYGTTKALMRVGPLTNARSYEWQLSTDNGVTWVNGGMSLQARRSIVTGLIPGTAYLVQVRAIGGSTGMSDWSMTAPIRAT